LLKMLSHGVDFPNPYLFPHRGYADEYKKT